ncbi:unnamed protein product [Pieris macdunnoughi]|uniref:Tc1-like transposase DDE domain-containing protein n=1 Tax=Pieris macdunnoughi TaxID=345717 RepID=A0A821XRB3_9NEOP|nr:unnamed protein product [Pieris macdunnoughi]
MADYRDDINRNYFMKWMEETLIPNLTEPSVIVMDNASYHVTQINKPPTMSSLKADIQKWLTEYDIPLCLNLIWHLKIKLRNSEETLSLNGKRSYECSGVHLEKVLDVLVLNTLKQNITYKNTFSVVLKTEDLTLSNLSLCLGAP